MATKKKTAKPQNVTFYRQSACWRPASITNESDSTSRELESIAIFDELGVICWLDSCELGDTLRDGQELEMSLPIIWKTYKEPDFSEARAHIVGRDFYGEKKYTLLIPAEAVTIESTEDRPRKWAGYTERYFTVKGFPAPFTKLYRHAFDQYAARDAIKGLSEDYYDNLRYETINTPQAQERIAQVWQTIKEFSAEAARIEAMSDAEYVAECIASAKEA